MLSSEDIQDLTLEVDTLRTSFGRLERAIWYARFHDRIGDLDRKRLQCYVDSLRVTVDQFGECVESMIP